MNETTTYEQVNGCVPGGMASEEDVLRLAREVLDGTVAYSVFRSRYTTSLAAACDYARAVETIDAASVYSAECEICHQPGQLCAFEWKATFVSIPLFLFVFLVRAPMALLAIVFAPGSGGDHSDSEVDLLVMPLVPCRTRHVLCKSCRPGIISHGLAGLFAIVTWVCVLFLSLAALMFGIMGIVYSLNTEEELAIPLWGIVLGTVSGGALLLSMAWNWVGTIESYIRLPLSLRRFLVGPFRLEHVTVIDQMAARGGRGSKGTPIK
jgi:hypothetical protein